MKNVIGKLIMPIAIIVGATGHIAHAQSHCQTEATAKAVEVVRELHAKNNWYEVYMDAPEFRGDGVYVFSVLAEMVTFFDVTIIVDQSCKVISVEVPEDL